MSIKDLFKNFSKTPSTVSEQDLIDAQNRIAPYLTPTPLTFSPSLSELAEREVFLKWENKHRTGSFKERGALNFLLALPPPIRSRGVCAASAGNHALAMSYYCAKLHIPCLLVMPKGAPLVKVSASRKCGAEIILFGSTFHEAYDRARALARERGTTFVPAYDHPHVIAGQGTAGLEICAELDDFDSVVVPVGGGGLIAGVAIAVKQRRANTYILGVQSEWTVNLRTATKKDERLCGPLAPVTIADGIAVKTIGDYNAPIISKCVDALVTVSENEIAYAILRLLEHEKTVVEGAGAASLAAVLRKALPGHLKKTVIIVSGSNIDVNLLSRLIDRDMADSGRLLKVMVSVPDAPGTLHATAGILASAGANVLQVFHDRSFSKVPGNVDVSFLAEVRDSTHKEAVLEALRASGMGPRELDQKVEDLSK